MESDGSPGETVAWKPVRSPSRTVIPGSRVGLEPLDPERHGAALFVAQGSDADPEVWTWMASGPFHDENGFRRYLEESARSDDPHFFAIVDAASGKAMGVAAYLRIDLPARPPCLRRAWLPAAGVEVQRAQRPLAPGRRAVRFPVRRHLPPAHGRQGAQSGHGLVRDHRQGVAAGPGRLRGMARPRQLRRRRCPAPNARGDPIIALARSLTALEQKLSVSHAVHPKPA